VEISIPFCNGPCFGSLTTLTRDDWSSDAAAAAAAINGSTRLLGEWEKVLLWLEQSHSAVLFVLSVEFSRPPTKPSQAKPSPQAGSPARREQTRNHRPTSLLVVEMNRQVLHNCFGSPPLAKIYRHSTYHHPPVPRAPSPSSTLSSYRSHRSSTLSTLHLPPATPVHRAASTTTNPQTVFRESHLGATQLCPRPHTLAWICEQSSSTILPCSATLQVVFDV
jgi:hypothetical protein